MSGEGVSGSTAYRRSVPDAHVVVSTLLRSYCNCFSPCRTRGATSSKAGRGGLRGLRMTTHSAAPHWECCKTWTSRIDHSLVPAGLAVSRDRDFHVPGRSRYIAMAINVVALVPVIATAYAVSALLSNAMSYQHQHKAGRYRPRETFSYRG